MKPTLIIALFLVCCNLIGQKIYFGWGYGFNIASATHVKYNNLAEAPNFYEPYKVVKHRQFAATAENLYVITLAAGFQSKKNFIELKASPLYIRTFIFKAEGSDFNGGSAVEKKITHEFTASNLNLSVKRVVTGRKAIRIALVGGLTGMYLYNKSTKLNSLEVDVDLFQFERKIYPLVTGGIEYIGNNGKNNLLFNITYEHQLLAFNDKLTNGYLMIGFNMFVYRNLAKREIYIHE